MRELRCPRCHRGTFYSPEYGRRVCQCGAPFEELVAVEDRAAQAPTQEEN